ncbi:MAG: PP2C family protein-serine/threonine phosphatase [Gemmataceae bacterium]
MQPEVGDYSFVTAGHPGPILLRANGRVEVYRIESSLIGLSEGGYEEHRLHLAPSDRLYLFSDGLIEAHDQHSSPSGSGQCAAIRNGMQGESLQRSLEDLAEQVTNWIGSNNPPHDDISMVAIERA